MYVIKTHDGKSLAIKQTDTERIKELAKRLELTAVELVTGEIVFLSKGTVARIEKDNIQQIEENDKQIEAPDYRGTPSEAKERVRDMLKEKGIL